MNFTAGSRSICAALLSLALLVSTAAGQAAEMGKQHVYIGTYTGPKSKGIYHAEFDPATGKLSTPELAAEIASPSFLNIHPNQQFLYAADAEGSPKGGVAAFAIDRSTGKLTRLGKTASCGTGPCYVAVDRAGKCVLAACYNTGTVAAMAIRGDGSLADAAEVIQQQDTGSSPPAKPHAHSINVDANNRFAVCADLGLNQLLVYRLDAEKAKLTPNDPPFTRVKPGSGPRHFAFHPGGKLAYSNMETSMQIVAFAWDPVAGTLTELQSLSTLPADYHGKGNSTAEIQLHPSGRFAYVSNRGHNSIAMFAIDPSTGHMTALGHQSTGGSTPRNFTIDPTGRYILAANQGSHDIVVLSIDAETGKLTPTGDKVEVGAPVCIKFAAY